jgi:phospholipase/lecithinase/hemolysin
MTTTFSSFTPTAVRRALAAALLVLETLASTSFAQQTPVFSRLIIFGDSLSDVGNVYHRSKDDFAGGYPSGTFNYSDGRWTNSTDTTPNSTTYTGVWHEQLARTFLNIPAETNSLDGGYDYAFGGATTNDGTIDRNVFTDPITGNDVTITIDNLGKQVTDYLAVRTPDANALYIVWGGGNDLFDDPSSENVVGAANRMGALVAKLARAGARNFLVPNLPPLGFVPDYLDDLATAQKLNEASADYRVKLNIALDSVVNTLAAEGITIQLYRVDVYQVFLRLAANPTAYGFTETRASAQDKEGPADKYLFWDNVHPTTAAHYQIAAAAFAVLNGTSTPPAKSANMSTRAVVGTGDNVLIGGLIVTGPASKKMVLRAIGPSLNVNGTPVAGRMTDPVLEIFQGTTPIASNDNWQQDPHAADISNAGLAPQNQFESATLQTLAPGEYTVVVRGQNNSGGIGLVEAFDLEQGSAAALANLSTRGVVQTGDNVLIGGFIVGSGSNATMVIRAIGPSLAQAGVANPLQDPMLELHDANGVQIDANDDWRDTQGGLLRATLLPPTEDAESAMVKSLPAGNYTAVVRGKNNSSGVGLVEIYNLQ